MFLMMFPCDKLPYYNNDSDDVAPPPYTATAAKSSDMAEKGLKVRGEINKSIYTYQ
jgi:hypothetical protein